MVETENALLALHAITTAQFFKPAKNVLSALMKITINYRLNIRIYIIGSKSVKGWLKIMKVNLKIVRIVKTLDLPQTKN
jgi:hypothetical protein